MARAPANPESTVPVDADAARTGAPDPTAPIAAGVRHEWSYWPGGQQAAFFDLDRTLIAGSSAFTFAIGAWRKDMVPTGQFAKDAVGAIAFKLRGDAGDENVAKVRERILHAVEGSRQQDLVALNETIVPKLLSKVRPEARTLLESHTQRGHATYIVSAAPVEIVEPLALALGMTAGLGTRAVVVDGIYTGALAGPFCYGPGKVDAIKEVAHWEGFDLSRCYAYSDSASDLPMLEAVGHPVAVNPDGRLGAAAATRGWPVVIFRRRTRQVVRRSTAGAAAVSLAGAGFAVGYQVARRR